MVSLGFQAWIPWRARQVQRKYGHDAAWRRRAAAIARARFADPQDVALAEVLLRRRRAAALAAA